MKGGEKMMNSLVKDMFDETDNSFTIKLCGTTYEVTTHFNPNGKQSVLQQFMELLKSGK
jgi:hypothetical protein